MTEQTIEDRARALGWVPQEEFRGDVEKWRSAEEFLQRGEEVMPILRANNRKLESELARLAAENKRLSQLYGASQEAITEIQQFHEANLKDSLARQKAELTAALREARADGDVVREVEIQDQIAELRQPKPKPEPKPAPVEEPAVHPDFAGWQADNPWFGKDTRKTQLAMGIAQQLRSDPEFDGLEGRAFYDKVSELMTERSAGPGKVASGRPTGGAARGSGKGYSDLPAEARDACDKQARKLVGEGRAFKDTASWQAYYAKIYFQGEAA